MCPGPIEIHPEVMKAMGKKCISFAHAPFIEVMGQALEKTRKIFQAGPKAQPFLVAGSGILGWEMAVTNLLEVGDEVIVCSNGIFGNRFATTFQAFGVKVTTVKGELGVNPTAEQVEKALKEGGDKIKLITFTHVETSTAVKCNIQEMAKLVKRVAPNVLICLDAVAATVAEECRMEEWGLDYVMTGSQKAIGVPPGLSITIVSERAMNVYKNRKTRYNSFFSNWDNWLPIMQAMEARKPAYFGTPPVNLILALNKSYDLILEAGLSEVWSRHARVHSALSAAITSIGLRDVPKPDHAANSLSCILLPEGIPADKFLAKCEEHKVVFAPAIHPDTKGKGFRFGTMGVSSWDLNRSDMIQSITAIEESLAALGHKFEEGTAVKTYKEHLGKNSSNL